MLGSMNVKELENFSRIFPQLSFCKKLEHIRLSKYYRVASSIYSFLCSNQKENGAIYDPYMSSTLDHQYHLSNFILSSVIFFIIEQKEDYYGRGCKCLEYLTSIPLEINRASLEFNNFPILLSYILLMANSQATELQKRLSNYISGMHHYGSKSRKNPYGNNFLTLRAVNHLLKYKVSGLNDDLESAQDFMQVSMSWQMEDGIFYDYPSTTHNENGIPSISYHAKITLMTLLYGLISQESEIINRGLNGLEALVKLIAPDGEAFYYGRTNNALYGYACGILALRVAANLMLEKQTAPGFAKYERLLFEFCSHHMAEDGHLYIVPNDLENVRCGFDAYMYVTVYNAFAMSMFLLCALMQDSDVYSENSKEPHDQMPKLDHLEQSGFLVQKSRKLSVSFNLKGHNYQSGYLLDPRFTGLTPLFLKFKGYDILPSIAFSPHIFLHQKSEGLGSKFIRKCREAYAEFTSWSYLNHHNPAHAGFIPFYEDKKKLYLPIDVVSSSITEWEGMMIIKSTARFISISRGGLLPVLIWLVPLLANYLSITRKQLITKTVNATSSSLERTIIIGDNFIQFHDMISQGMNAKLYFGIRTYHDVIMESESHQMIFRQKDAGMVLLFGREETLENKKVLCSSKGPSYFWKINCKANNEKRKINGPIKVIHTLIPFDAENNMEESIRKFSKINKMIKNDCLEMEIHK